MRFRPSSSILFAIVGLGRWSCPLRRARRHGPETPEEALQAVEEAQQALDRFEKALGSSHTTTETLPRPASTSWWTTTRR